MFKFPTIALTLAGLLFVASQTRAVNDGFPHEEPGNVAVDSEVTVDFERHVAPMLGRLGCNSAACHGAFGGKGGLQLSLFGYSTRMDYDNLSQRVDTDDPSESLMLLKPSGMEDHEGGVRFDSESDVYQTIHRWIEQGANWRKGSGKVAKLTVEPRELVFSNFGTSDNTAQSMKVWAEFNDGSIEDVTELCQFTSRDEGIATVSPGGQVDAIRNGDTFVIISYRDAFAAVNAMVPYQRKFAQDVFTSGEDAIDQHVTKKLRSLNIQPSQKSSDSEFLRRVTVDTIGTLPTADEVRAFCKDTDPQKREKKIDELLSHPMHAALWATRMCDITKCDVTSMGDDDQLRHRRAQMWHEWFRRRFADNVSYDKIAEGVIIATSRDDDNLDDWIRDEEEMVRSEGGDSYSKYAEKVSLDLYWRRINEQGNFPLKEVSELTAAAFTGVQMNCAQCHKHPFDRWTQDDYAAFTNIFSSVVYGNSPELNKAIFAELESRREQKQNGESVEPLPKLREVFTSGKLGRAIPGSKPGVRVTPRAFESKEFVAAGQEDLRYQFLDWLTHPNNEYFARNFANRVWAVYFGVGIVEPVDDFSISNPPSHPELLRELAGSFVESGFDIRALEKRILMSQAYQRSSTPNETNHADSRNYARQYVRPFLAEVTLDCINKSLGVEDKLASFLPEGTLAIEIGTNAVPGSTGRTLEILGRGQRQSICDCDRRNENDLRQYVYLVNDSAIFKKIEEGKIRELLELDNDRMVEELYLRFYGRLPTAAESRNAQQHLEVAMNREAAFDDLVWAFLNSREFITNH